MPIASGPGRAEEQQGPTFEEFGGWLDDYFHDFFIPGGRQDLGGFETWADISLGFPRILELLGSGIGIPVVVQPPIFGPPTQIFATPGYNPSANSPGSVNNMPESWRKYEEMFGALPANWNKFPTPIEWDAAAGAVSSALPQNTNAEASMDLGANIFDLAGSLIGSYIDTRFGQPPPQQSFVGQNYVSPRPGVVGVDTSALYNQDGTLRTKCKRRRRRKRLATASDIRDLASLEGVLGKGTLMKTWIATHPS